jgi:hypothetical protein
MARGESAFPPATIHQLHHKPVEPWGGFLPAEIIERPKPREWIVNGMVPRKTTVMLAGAPKRGKSLLAQQMLTACALGVPWIGAHTEKVRALGLFMEDDKDELTRRQFNICQAYGTELGSLGDDLELNPREMLSTRLFDYKRGDYNPIPTPLWDRLWQVVEDGRFEIIVLDTASLVFGGNAIINIEKVTNSLREINKKAATFNAAVVITVHTNKADPSGFSGPNAWLGTVRAAMNLNIAFDDHTQTPLLRERELKDLGGNYGVWDPIRLRWFEGVWETVAPEPLARPQTTEDREEFNWRVLAYLRKCVERGMTVAIDDQDDSSLPRRLHRAQKLALNDVNGAVEWMLNSNHAAIVKVGRKCMIRPVVSATGKTLSYDGEAAWTSGQ